MAVLPQLANPSDYRPIGIDLEHDPEARRHWLGIFTGHLPSLMQHAIESEGDRPDARQRAAATAARFNAILQTYQQQPNAFGPVSIIRLAALREECLRTEGFADPYRPVKTHQTAAALELLPDWLAKLDRQDEPTRLQWLIEGIFAGNIFDLGARKTIQKFADADIDFHATRRDLPPRPWLVDDFDRLAKRWTGPPHHKAVMFVDNAGADIVLGMIPLARELLRRGTAVVMAANSTPALNDITHDELVELIDQVADIDAAVRDAHRDGQFQLVASGNGTPLIDLTQIAGDLAAASADADFVILEGMGRALESNFDAPLTCDALKLGMVKEDYVAKMFGGKMYDVVCRFEPQPGD